MTLIFFISSLHLCIFFPVPSPFFLFLQTPATVDLWPLPPHSKGVFLSLADTAVSVSIFCHSSNTATRTHEIWEINHCHCSSTSERNIPHCVCLCVWLHTVSFLSVWFCLYCVFPISQDIKHKHSLSPFVWVLCVFSYFAGLSTAQVFSLQ